MQHPLTPFECIATPGTRILVDTPARMWHHKLGTTTGLSQMERGLDRSFGLLISTVLPGLVVLLGASTHSTSVEHWLFGSPASGVAFGGVIYATAISVFVGMVIGAIRWVLIDTVHHLTGLRRPTLNDAWLQANLSAFDRLVEDHFRYYQFYANTAIALPIAYALAYYGDADPLIQHRLSISIVLVLELVLIAGSRDALRRYYVRTSTLLNSRSEHQHDERKSPQTGESQD